MTTNLDKPKVRAAIYVRVSTKTQVDGTSPAQQREDCMRWCEDRQATIVGVFEDLGVSGTEASRPGLDRMLSAVRAGDVDAVVVAKMDRLTRESMSSLIGELDRYRVPLVSVAEQFDASASGLLQRDILGSFAAFERRRIMERTMAGHRRRVAEGAWVFGNPPFGFRLEMDGRGRRTVLVVDEDDAATLREMVRCLVDERMSTKETAARLNMLASAERERRRIDPSDRSHQPWEPQRTSRWRYSHVRRTLLDGDQWCGSITVRYSDDSQAVVAAPVIFAPERYAQLRRRLDETSTGPRATIGHYLVGGGRLKSECGSSMFGLARRLREGKADIYSCYAHKIDGACACKGVNAEAVDAEVWAEIVAMLTDPARLQQIAGVAIEQRHAGATTVQDVATLDRRIVTLERRIGSEAAKLIAAGLSAEAAVHATRALDDEMRALRKHRDEAARWAAANESRASRAEQLWKLADSARRWLLDPTPELRSKVVDLLDVRVRIDGREVCVTCEGRRRIGRGPGTGRQAPLVCPTCQGFGSRPSLVITGVLPAESSLGGAGAERPDEFRPSFRLVV